MQPSYGYPYYWGGVGVWGENTYPYMMLAQDDDGEANVESPGLNEPSLVDPHQPDPDSSDPHLRSCEEVMGYRIDATDGDIGHVHDLLVDEETWVIRYLVVKTSNWWGGHEVIIVPLWITGVSWAESRVLVSLTRQQVKDAPAYSSSAELDRKREEELHRHYGRDGYWDAATRHRPMAPERNNFL